MSTDGTTSSAGDTYQAAGVAVMRIGGSVKLTRTDVPGGSIHIPVEDADDISAAISSLAEK